MPTFAVKSGSADWILTSGRVPLSSAGPQLGCAAFPGQRARLLGSTVCAARAPVQPVPERLPLAVAAGRVRLSGVGGPGEPLDEKIGLPRPQRRRNASPRIAAGDAVTMETALTTWQLRTCGE